LELWEIPYAILDKKNFSSSQSDFTFSAYMTLVAFASHKEDPEKAGVSYDLNA